MSFFSCWKSLYYLRRHCHYTVIFCYIHVHLEATKWSKNTPIHYTLNIYVVFSWKLRIHLNRSCPADDRCPCCELSQESTEHAMYIDLSTIMFILPLKPFMLPRKLEIFFWCTGWTCAVQSTEYWLNGSKRWMRGCATKSTFSCISAIYLSVYGLAEIHVAVDIETMKLIQN